MMEWRPNALRSSGEEHTRYRRAYTAGIGKVDLYTLHAAAGRACASLINTFCESGSAELLSQYAFPLTFQMLSHLLGFPPQAAEEIAAGMAHVLDGTDAENRKQRFAGALRDLVAHKRAQPSEDLTSWLLAGPTDLDDAEVVEQAAMLYQVGTEPTCNLILNTLRLILTDEGFAGEVLSGAMSTRDAIDEVLFTDPPLANFCMSYPRQPKLIGDVWLPAHQPVVISLAACNSDPAVAGERTGNRSHLAWGAGPHACTAQSIALVIAQEAIDQLLDMLPEIRLAVPTEQLSWRPGPFHRAMAALPVVFPASPPLKIG